MVFWLGVFEFALARHRAGGRIRRNRQLCSYPFRKPLQYVGVLSPGDRQVLLEEGAYQCQDRHQLDQLEALGIQCRLCELELGDTFTYNSHLSLHSVADDFP